MRIITLLSDFGLRDSYVALMKSVIYQEFPRALIVDISHDIEQFNIEMGSFVLETAVPRFPRNTIHVAVVDPGVGSDRRGIAIKCEKGILIGPDNGLMARASEKLSLQSIYEIRQKVFLRKTISNTFHGRDIFAYSAARFASGTQPNEIGSRIQSIKRLNLSTPSVKGSELSCQVLHVDVFGNVITNVEHPLIQNVLKKAGDRFKARSKARTLPGQFVKAYHEVNRGSLALLEGSHGYLELAIREGSAKDRLDVNPLDKLRVRF